MDEPSTTTGGTRLPGMRGVEHVGITVPDIEQATAFFVDVLGCELLYEREPPKDDSPRDRLGVPAVAESRPSGSCAAPMAQTSSCSSSTRPTSGGVPAPERLRDTAPGALRGRPGAAVKHLEGHGVELLDGPNLLPGPEAGEGNRFIYARTPWGLTVELISYPASMVYEQHQRRPPLEAHANRSIDVTRCSIHPGVLVTNGKRVRLARFIRRAEAVGISPLVCRFGSWVASLDASVTLEAGLSLSIQAFDCLRVYPSAASGPKFSGSSDGKVHRRLRTYESNPSR